MNFCDIDTSNCSWGGTDWRQTLKLVAVKFQIELRVVFILCNILIVNNHHLRTSTHFIWKNNEKEHCFVRLPRVVKTNSWHINFNTPQNRIYLISSKQCKDFLGCFIYFYNKRAMKETIIVEKKPHMNPRRLFFSLQCSLDIFMNSAWNKGTLSCMVQINGRISDLFYSLLFKWPPSLSCGDGGM